MARAAQHKLFVSILITALLISAAYIFFYWYVDNTGAYVVLTVVPGGSDVVVKIDKKQISTGIQGFIDRKSNFYCRSLRQGKHKVTVSKPRYRTIKDSLIIKPTDSELYPCYNLISEKSRRKH